MSNASPLQRHAATVTAKRQASERTLLLELALAQGSTFSYRPGQFIGLDAADGRARYFSIANAVSVDNKIELHINRVPGGTFTSELFDTTKAGDKLWMTGPFGDFGIATNAAPNLILVAGGTGFAPIKACLQQLALSDADRHRSIHLYWGVRAAPDLYDLDGVRALSNLLPGLRFIPVLDQCDPGAGYRQGPVHRAVVEDFQDLADHDIYACGAPAMIEALARDCTRERGFDPARLVADIFVAGGVRSPASPVEGALLEVMLETRTGFRAIPGACGEALLFALTRAGLPMQSVCGGKGACGTCRVQITPDWRLRIPEPSKRESRLLHCVGARAGDRLSCQILLAAELSGLRLSIPVDNQGA